MRPGSPAKDPLQPAPASAPRSDDAEPLTVDSPTLVDAPAARASPAVANASDASALARTEVSAPRFEAHPQTPLRPGNTERHRAAPAVSAPPSLNLSPAPLDDQGFSARYEQIRVLGEGGMGEVHLCKDQRIGRDVAMKLIKRGHGSRSDVRSRFEREARVQGQLEHPSVVPVYDLGIGVDGAAFFTMKRIRGKTLEQVLQGIEQGDPATVATWSRRKLLGAYAGICLAMAFAHARGVLHRDLKPGNVMLGDFGELYVLDWGLAKVANTLDLPRESAVDAPPLASDKTQDGAMMGTPGYMAPEQVRGENDRVDARSDVYALGAILFEMLALEPLHPRVSVEAIVTSTLRGVESRPSVRAPDRGVPPELDAICVQATSLDPGERYPSAAELSSAVEHFLDGDRDLEQRRVMAEEHAWRAAEAMDRLGQGSASDRKARERAMREVGAALALDPTHQGAVTTMMRLLLDAPAEMPADARAEFEASKQGVNLTARRSSLKAYAIGATTLPILFWLGIRSKKLLLVVCALSALTPIISFLVTRRDRKFGASDRGRLWVFALGMVGISATSFLFGPLILVPSMAATNTTGFMLLLKRKDRPLAIALGVASVLVPFWLELVGVLPPAYDFSRGGMTVLPQLTELPMVPTLTFLTLLNALLIIAPALLIGRVRDALASSEERVFMHAWNIRQLIPDAARGAAAVPRARMPLN